MKMPTLWYLQKAEGMIYYTRVTQRVYNVRKIIKQVLDIRL